MAQFPMTEGISVTRHMTLRSDEQYQEIESILLSGRVSTERQDVYRLNNTCQVAVTYAAAFILSVIHGQTTGEIMIRGRQEMAVVPTEHPHIVRDPRIGHGEPIIVGTAVRVRILVEYWREGTPPEELLQAFPHLTLAQVFDALSYYQDHQDEINAFIAQNRVNPSLLHDSVRRRA